MSITHQDRPICPTCGTPQRTWQDIEPYCPECILRPHALKSFPWLTFDGVMPVADRPVEFVCTKCPREGGAIIGRDVTRCDLCGAPLEPCIRITRYSSVTRKESKILAGTCEIKKILARQVGGSDGDFGVGFAWYEDRYLIVLDGIRSMELYHTEDEARAAIEDRVVVQETSHA